MNEVFGEVFFEEKVDAVHEGGVCRVFFRESGFVFAEGDFLGDYGGADGGVRDVVFAAERGAAVFGGG